MKKLILFVLLLAVVLISCGIAEEKINTANETTTLPDETAPDDNKDDLGEFNFDGYAFNMLTRNTTWYHGLINTAEENGDPINDAIYLRNRRIEERFNFTFEEVPGNDSAQTTNIARNSILAGDNDYDIVSHNISICFTFAQEGLIYPITALPFVNLDKNYWDSKLTSDLMILNKIFFAVGSFELSGYDYTYSLLFNKKLFVDYDLEYPYNLVNTGKWTFDVFTEMIKTATIDVNGDGKFDADDKYGYLSSPKYVLPNFWIAAGLKTVEKDKDGIPYSAMGNTKFDEVFNRIFEMTYDTNAWYRNTLNSNFEERLNNMFINNQGLFMPCSFFFIDTLRGMETDFGIIPYPKYTETQESYLTPIESVVLAMTPITSTDEMLERTSVILEALAYESKSDVIPAYYNLTLKTKMTRDAESESMLDLIFDNRVFDFGHAIWFSQIRDGVFSVMYSSNNRNLASKLASMETTIQDLSDKIVEAFEKLK